MNRAFERPSQSPVKGREQNQRQSPSRQASAEGIGMTSLRTRKRLVERLKRTGIRNQLVLDAMLETPRHLFVDGSLVSSSYDDVSLPIGFGQTISQPWVVARMTESLLGDTQSGQRLKNVLEVGTGCGYQTAVLAAVADRVCSVERILGLQQQAIQRLRRLQLFNVQCKHVDGQTGWPTFQPYDGIIVTAAAPGIPQALIEQLAPGGRMVIPVGDGANQELKLILKTREGIEQMSLGKVCFVPLLSGESE